MAMVLTVFSPKVLGHLKDELGLPTDDGEGIEDLWEAFIEPTSTTAPITETTWLSSLNSGVPIELVLYKE